MTEWLYRTAAAATQLPLHLTVERLGGVFLLTLIMCAISSLLALNKIRDSTRQTCSDDGGSRRHRAALSSLRQGSTRKQILFDVSTVIPAGEIVIVEGPSGSGKTTLLTIIGSLRSAQEGSVRVLGEEAAGGR